MKMSELIAQYGDDRIKFQNLDDCADSLNMGKKGITKITFGTEQRVDLKGTEMFGLVLWFDRKAVADIIAASKKAQMVDTRGEANPNSASQAEGTSHE